MHRPTSGPATTHPLPSQRSGVAHSGVSTGTLLRRASMPTDSLQLYHPLSLQSLPHSGSGTIGTDPYYTPSSQRNVLENGYVSGRSSSVIGNYSQHSGGTGATGYTFPTPASMSTQQQQSGYSMGSQHNPTYLSSHGPLPAGGSHGYYTQQQQYFPGGHQDRSTPTPSSGSGPGYHPQ